MLKVFLTVILWAVLMFVYSFLSFLTKRIGSRVYEWKIIIPTCAVMLIYTIICRVGFGSASVIEPTWTYKINTDLTLQKFYGFLGLFPEALFWVLFLIERLVDLIFWYCIKRGLDGAGEEDIKQVRIVQAKYEPVDRKELEKSNIYMIEHEFEAFG